MKTENLPDIAELYGDIELKQDANKLNILLNQPPAKAWIRLHPMATKKVGGQFVPIEYIPIERIEWLLTRIFTRWNVEVRSIQQIANSVCVVVRLYYLDVLSNEMLWQDGIGAAPLQTDQGAGATDWNAIKSASVQIGAPAAESYAVKDAAEKIGKLFGKDINRADAIGYDNLIDKLPDDEPAGAEQIKRIYKLLSSSVLPEEQRQAIESELMDMTVTSAFKCIRMLQMNQQDPVHDGNYSATDIQSTLLDIIKDERK